MSKRETVGEMWQLVVRTRKFWLVPIIFVMVLLGGILAAAGGSALAPFIYTIF